MVLTHRRVVVAIKGWIQFTLACFFIGAGGAVGMLAMFVYDLQPLLFAVMLACNLIGILFAGFGITNIYRRD